VRSFGRWADSLKNNKEAVEGVDSLKRKHRRIRRHCLTSHGERDQCVNLKFVQRVESMLRQEPRLDKALLLAPPPNGTMIPLRCFGICSLGGQRACHGMEKMCYGRPEDFGGDKRLPIEGFLTSWMTMQAQIG
jgi:hypothetical protein